MTLEESIELIESNQIVTIKVFYNDGQGNLSTLKAEKSFDRFEFQRGLWFARLRATVGGREVDFLEGGDPEPKSEWTAFFRENRPMYVTRTRPGVYAFGKKAYDSAN